MKLTVDQAIRKAATLARNGQSGDAERLYREILQRFPANKRASDGLHALSTSTIELPPQQEVQALLEIYSQGKADEVVQRASALIERFPNAWLLHNIVGAACAQLGRFEAALTSFGKAVRFKPDHAEAHYNCGVALQELKRLDEALASYDRALQLKPDLAEAHNNRGNALKELKRLDEAVASYDKARRLKPDYAEAYYKRGVALHELKRLKEALASYGKALQLKPDYAEAYYMRGVALHELKRLEEALASYDKALQLKPDHAEAYNNRGVALYGPKRLEEALASYDKALQLNPDYAEAYNNRGVALYDLKRLDDALASYDKAVQRKPDYADAHYNRGNALHDLKRLDEAVASYDRALQIKPDFAGALCQMLYQQAHMCDWAESARSDNPEKLGIAVNGVSPFIMLTMDDCPLRNLERSKAWAKAKFPAVQPFAFKPVMRTQKLRIGYFSADFHNHATMYLMAKVFELHDKSRFEVHAFSYGANIKDVMRQRLLDAVGQFHDVSAISDPQIAELARSEAIDIAIDLKGYTTNSRSGIFAYRAAPVQINYLGYPGSMGTEFIDYIIADRVVVPQTDQQFYTEKVIYLPHSYQANDNQRAVSERCFERSEVGLPENGFVFCCFNNNYKISSVEFDIWMRLLGKVEGSVLWLFEANKWAHVNLRKEAEVRGIDANRLIFAGRMPLADHLARYHCADLFLDTFNCNAHTTASDALWAGLPVVTKLGKGFPARVAGSLLHAMDLPELVTDTVQAYGQLALALATNPDRLAAVRAKLAANRLTTPLFDTEQFTHHIERAYELAYGRYSDGLPPDHIHVD